MSKAMFSNIGSAHLDEDWMQNLEDYPPLKEITDWYAEKVNQILEATMLLYKQDKESIKFVVVVDHIRRDHSFQLSDIACELDDLYPHWDFDFQYISIRTAAQLPLDEYSDLINGG